MFDVQVLCFEEEGALVRLFGAIERRGFVVHQIIAGTSRARGHMHLTLSVRGRGRGASYLLPQLRKLPHVLDVALLDARAGSHARAAEAS